MLPVYGVPREVGVGGDIIRVQVQLGVGTPRRTTVATLMGAHRGISRFKSYSTVHDHNYTNNYSLTKQSNIYNLLIDKLTTEQGTRATYIGQLTYSSDTTTTTTSSYADSTFYYIAQSVSRATGTA